MQRASSNTRATSLYSPDMAAATGMHAHIDILCCSCSCCRNAHAAQDADGARGHCCDIWAAALARRRLCDRRGVRGCSSRTPSHANVALQRNTGALHDAL